MDTLTIRERIYLNNPHRVHDRILKSDSTIKFENMNNFDEQNNVKKAEFIFASLSNFIDYYDDDYCYYKDIQKIEAISILDGRMQISYIDKDFYAEGYEICNIHIDRIIMLEIYTNDSIIRIDFEGLIDNEDGYQVVYQSSITDENVSNHLFCIQEKRIIEDIKKQYNYDCIYRYQDISTTIHDVDDYKYMIKISSNTFDETSDKYQSNFGFNNQYINDINNEILRMQNIQKAIQNKYQDKIKAFLSDWNEECPFGCTLYVYIL